jgi:hypothetical protein
MGKNNGFGSVYNTVTGYRGAIYGIIRTGFVSELDAWRWIANVMGVTIAVAMRGKEKEIILTKKNRFVA